MRLPRAVSGNDLIRAMTAKKEAAAATAPAAKAETKAAPAAKAEPKAAEAKSEPKPAAKAEVTEPGVVTLLDAKTKGDWTLVGEANWRQEKDGAYIADGRVPGTLPVSSAMAMIHSSSAHAKPRSFSAGSMAP